ncbi:MAG: NADH:flavin oxidoreductase/NADH oxidase [Alphaproteobacteria bacterium]|nr:NADH:flavin oxidoreductase/NADH oxidase [Alphaproteobacteria bacterium]
MPGLDDVMLFKPLTLRGVTIPNRVVIAPMQMYMATKDGFYTDWHLVHLGRYAIGKAGLIFTEVLCVEPRGRSTYSDAGIWDDAHVGPLKRVADFLRSCGSVPGVQIGHCGPKAARQRPHEGLKPLGPAEAAKGEPPWTPVASTDEPSDAGYHVPHALTTSEVQDLVATFGRCAARVAPHFDVLDIHAAHGYLIHTFLSPIANKRTDRYGGDRQGRMRFALEIAEAVRAAWPQDKPIFFRLSCIDRAPGGWEMPDTLALAQELRARGIDVIDCSSGGIRGANSIAIFKKIGPPAPGYQVPFAAEVKKTLGMPTMAVGLIAEAKHAEAILRAGDADLVAIAREALANPHWALHASNELQADPNFTFDYWPPNHAWWLQYREEIRRMGRTGAKKDAAA